MKSHFKGQSQVRQCALESQSERQRQEERELKASLCSIAKPLLRHIHDNPVYTYGQMLSVSDSLPMRGPIRWMWDCWDTQNGRMCLYNDKELQNCSSIIWGKLEAALGL